jgi:crotonobetainyl-CoA:carnitine CoA-transferase CaiB-like acyl-CoA transferase
LIVVAVSCYGANGPYADRPGAGTLAEAFGGLTHMIGEPDGPPMLPSVALGDILTAFSGVIGALAACYHRDAGAGRGQFVDVSMYEPVLQFLGPTLIGYRPGDPAPRRTGSRVSGGVPRNVYRTADDRWIVISGTTDAQVARFLPLLGRSTPGDVARFGSSAARLEHAEELDRLVAAWVGARPGDAALEELLRARIPAAPVNDIPALLTDPHLLARADIVTIEDERAGPMFMAAPSPRLSATPAAIRGAAPRLGQHNEEIYGGLLGLPADSVKRLSADGVL